MVFVSLLLPPVLAKSGPKGAETTLIVMDVSPAMSSSMGTSTRLSELTGAVQKLLTFAKDRSNIELMTYGYRPNSACTDLTFDTPIRSDSTRLLDAQLDCVTPGEKLPLDLVLNPQIKRLTETGQIAKIVVLSGGNETFNLDPCENQDSITEANEGSVEVHVIELGESVAADSGKQLSCLAQAHQGKYTYASDSEKIWANLFGFMQIESRALVSLEAAFDSGKVVNQADMVWEITPKISEQGGTLNMGAGQVRFAGAGRTVVFYPGLYEVRIQGDTFSAEQDFEVKAGVYSEVRVSLTCHPGHHTDSAENPTTCLSDLNYASCGAIRQDCNAIKPGKGHVTCAGERCEVVCEPGFHSDSDETPSVCISDTDLKSCGVNRLDCTGRGVDRGSVGCDGVTCALTCDLGYYPQYNEDGFACLDNRLTCDQSELSSTRAYIAWGGGAATLLGGIAFFITERVAAGALEADVQAYNSATRRPRSEQLELLDRGASIGTLEAIALTVVGLGAAVLGYGALEYGLSPSAQAYACDKLVPVDLMQDFSEESESDTSSIDEVTP